MNCPECGSKGYIRKTKTPEWRCRKCAHEWDGPYTNPGFEEAIPDTREESEEPNNGISEQNSESPSDLSKLGGIGCGALIGLMGSMPLIATLRVLLPSPIPNPQYLVRCFNDSWRDSLLQNCYCPSNAFQR